MNDQDIGTRWSEPWVVVAVVGVALAAGGVVHPWWLARSVWSLAVPVEAGWRPWFLVLLVAAVAVLAVVVQRGDGPVRPELALLLLVPATVLSATTGDGITRRGSGAALAFGGVLLLMLAASARRAHRPRRLTPAGRGALAAVTLLVLASAVPWSEPRPRTGAFALPGTGSMVLVWTVGLLAGACLATTTLVARRRTTGWVGILTAAGAVAAVWFGSGGADNVDRSSPGVRLALLAGMALLVAAILRRGEHEPPETEIAEVPSAPALASGPLAVAAASCAWLATLAATAPWALGPPSESIPRRELSVLPASWGGDLVGQPAIAVVAVGVPVLVLVVGWLGRRALPAAATMIGVTVAAASAGPVMAGGSFTAAPMAALVLGVGAVVLGTASAVLSGPGLARFAPALALPAVALFSLPDLTPERDGPYEILQAGRGSLRPGAVATSASMPETSGDRLDRYPIWIDDEPGVVTRDGSYRIRQGRISLASDDEALLGGWADQVGDYLAGEVHYLGGDRVVRLHDLSDPGPPLELHDVDRLALSAAGQVLLRAFPRQTEQPQWYEGDLAAYAAAAAADAAGVDVARHLADDPAWEPVAGLTGDARESVIVAGDAWYVVGPESVEQALPDGSRIPVLGGDCDPSSRAAGTQLRFERLSGSTRGRIDADATGALWFVGSGPSGDDLDDAVYRRSPDGELEVIDHALWEVESLEMADDGGLLLIDGTGRLLHLADAASALTTLPEPDEGCEVPEGSSPSSPLP